MIETLQKLIKSTKFELLILTVILINTFSLAAETIPDLSRATHQLLSHVDSIAIAIFVIEAAIKLVALRIDYFKSAWNVFDFVVVIAAVITITHYLSILRSLRIIRAFRLVAYIKPLRQVVGALARSIPGLISTAFVLLLVFFIFGIMGVQLFGSDFPAWFGHLGRSMFTLFQIMTLESWSMGIVRPIMEIYPYAWLFFIPFILVSAFTLLNFLIGIVVDAIAHLKHMRERQESLAHSDKVIQHLEKIERLLTQRD